MRQTLLEVGWVQTQQYRKSVPLIFDALIERRQTGLDRRYRCALSLNLGDRRHARAEG